MQYCQLVHEYVELDASYRSPCHAEISQLSSDIYQLMPVFTRDISHYQRCEDK